MRLSTSILCTKNGQARSAMSMFWRWQSGGAAKNEQRREWLPGKGTEFEIKDYQIPFSEASQSPSCPNYYSNTWEIHKAHPSAAHTTTDTSSGDQLAESAQQCPPHQRAASSTRAPPLFIHRDWQHASHVPLTSLQETFVITSFNILASKHAYSHRNLYPAVPSHLLAWGRRRRILLKKLVSCSPDIVCLQEVDRFKDLEEDLALRGYAGLYKARTGEMPDGCAIFWRKERFQLLQERSFEFSMLGMRHNVAQLCVLQLIVPGLTNSKNCSSLLRSEQQAQTYRLIVGNIHVLFNPKRGEIKLGQCRAFLEQVHYMSSNWNGAPVVIGGDFNSTPSSAVYKYLATSELDLSNLDPRYLSGLIPEVPSPNLNKSRKEEGFWERLKERSVSEGSTDELASEKLQMGLQMAPSPEKNSMERAGAINQSNSYTSLDSNLEDINGESNRLEQILGSTEQTSECRTSVTAILKGASETIDASREYTAIGLEERHDTNKSYETITTEVSVARTSGLPTTVSYVAQECAESGPLNHVQTSSNSSSSSTKRKCEDFCSEYGWDSEGLRIATGKPDCTMMQHALNLYSAYSDIQGYTNTRDARGEPLVTTCHKDFLGTVDYIWRNDGLKTMRVLDTVPVQAFAKNKGLPVLLWGSDHLPLVCELAFT